MKYFKIVSIGFLMSLLIACSSDDDQTNVTDNGTGDVLDEISDNPFSGTIDDIEFEVGGSKGELTFAGVDEDLRPIENDGVEKLKFILRATDFDCDIDFDRDSFAVSGIVETEQIGFQITNIETATAAGIVNESGGLVELVSINDTEAVIRIKTLGEDYDLEGRFTVTICPES